MLLAVDNSQSMTGRPLREAKRAAEEFLMGQSHAGATGLVAFAHEALALTRPDEAKSDVGRALTALAPDVQTGTSLYDAVELSAARLQRMSNGTRILVLLTDGRDLGSRSSLSEAIAAAQRANVVVYSIAAGTRADRQPLAALATRHRRQAVRCGRRHEAECDVPHAQPGARPYVAALVPFERATRGSDRVDGAISWSVRDKDAADSRRMAMTVVSSPHLSRAARSHLWSSSRWLLSCSELRVLSFCVGVASRSSAGCSRRT